MDYYPKNYTNKLTSINEIIEIADEVERIDFSSIVDDSIDGSDDFASQANKELGKTVKNLSSEIESLKNELFGDIEQDFTNRLEFYEALVINKIEDSEIFPFRDWFSCLDGTKDKINFFSIDITLKTIQNIKKKNKELANENFAEYLTVIKNRLDYPNKFLADLNKFIKENYPEVNIVNLLSGKNLGDFHKGLNNEKVNTPTKDSVMLFQYGAVMVKELDFNDNGKSLKDFKNSEIYKNLFLNNETETCFIDELLKPRAGKNPFYTQKITNSNYLKYRVDVINWDNCREFVNNVFEENIKGTECFVGKILSFFDKKKQEEINLNAINLINISMYHQLNKEISVNETKQNKLKI